MSSSLGLRGAKREEWSVSIVLLDAEGSIVRKLQLVSLSDNYVVPAGMTAGWTTVHQRSSRVVTLSQPEPPEAYFYFGNAWAEVVVGGFR